MKQIPGNANGAAWGNSLLSDINTIKSKLRYPIKGKTLAPILFWGVIIVLIVSLSVFLITVGVEGDERPLWMKAMVGTSGIFLMVMTIIRHLQALRFIAIETPYHLQENILLVDSFLKAEHMLIFRHPDAPEVFQIQSRNKHSKVDDDREIMIFIADDRRILINSHFTNSGWKANPGSRHHKEFGKMLQQYISSQSHNTGIVHQTF
jgi:hypothetical protein